MSTALWIVVAVLMALLISTVIFILYLAFNYDGSIKKWYKHLVEYRRKVKEIKEQYKAKKKKD